MSKVAELRKRVVNPKTKKEMTQLELAQAVGVTESTISNWEKGRNALVWFERVAKLCKTLNCAPDDLIDYVSVEEDQPNVEEAE